jgi:hypothetical protein
MHLNSPEPAPQPYLPTRNFIPSSADLLSLPQSGNLTPEWKFLTCNEREIISQIACPHSGNQLSSHSIKLILLETITQSMHTPREALRAVAEASGTPACRLVGQPLKRPSARAKLGRRRGGRRRQRGREEGRGGSTALPCCEDGASQPQSGKNISSQVKPSLHSQAKLGM